MIGSYPHDAGAFTEGLAYYAGCLYEGTGLEGQSTIRRVELSTGVILQERKLEDRFFGEGITILNSLLFQLTWNTGVCFAYDCKTLSPIRQFRYTGEGWGLTSDGKRLIMSDGSAVLKWMDPATFKETRRLAVFDGQRPVSNLNELEHVNGDIYANILDDTRIAQISAVTGQVKRWFSLANLRPNRGNRAGVLNGIAYNPDRKTFLVTGKLWPNLFEIVLV